MGVAPNHPSHYWIFHYYLARTDPHSFLNNFIDTLNSSRPIANNSSRAKIGSKTEVSG